MFTYSKPPWPVLGWPLPFFRPVYFHDAPFSTLRHSHECVVVYRVWRLISDFVYDSNSLQYARFKTSSAVRWRPSLCWDVAQPRLLLFLWISTGYIETSVTNSRRAKTPLSLCFIEKGVPGTEVGDSHGGDWFDNIKMDLLEVGGGGDWMELAQGRDRWWALVNTVMNFGFHKVRGISWLAAEPVSFSRRSLLHGVSKLVRWLKILFWDVCGPEEVCGRFRGTCCLHLQGKWTPQKCRYAHHSSQYRIP